MQSILGAKLDNIQQNLNALIHKDRETVVIHAGTNNSLTDTPQNIVDKLIKLKRSIEALLTRCRVIISRGRSRTAATSKMECFAIIVNGWKPLTIITKRSILDVAAVLDPPLIRRLIIRIDNSKANVTNRNANELIKTLKIQTVENNNIVEKHLGKGGLY